MAVRKVGQPRKGSLLSAVQILFYEDDEDLFDQTIEVGLGFLDGSRSVEQVRDLVYEKMVEPEALWRFRSQIRIKNNEVWFQEIDKGDIDMTYHVATLFEGEEPTVQDVYDWVGKQYDFELRMDNSQPLWRLMYVPKLTDGRSLAILLVNHAIGDGASLISVFYSLTNYFDEARPRPLRAKKTSTLRQQVMPKLSWNDWFWMHIKGLKQATGIGSRKDDLNPLLKFSRKRVVGVSESLSVDRVKDVARALGGRYTVNDIVMTLLNLTVVRYFQDVDPSALEQDAEGNDKKVTGGFPIDLRPSGHDVLKYGASNGFLSGGWIQLVMNYSSRKEVLEEVTKRLDLFRLTPTTGVYKFMATKVAPNVMSVQDYRKMQKDALGFLTCLLSNLKGPTEQLQILGCDVTDLQFFNLTQTPNIFGVFSYNGEISCSMTVDAEAEQALEKMSKYWKSEFEALYEEVMEPIVPT